MCVILFPFLFYYVIYYCLLHVFITYFYFILHVILGVCFYLFYFYFLLYCMNLKSPNPTHVPGPFAPLASSPPCTHLCPLVSNLPLALPSSLMHDRPYFSYLHCLSPSSMKPSHTSHHLTSPHPVPSPLFHAALHSSHVLSPYCLHPTCLCL